MSFAYSPANSLPIAKLLERFIPLDFAVHKLHNSKELNDFLLNQTDFTAGIEFDDHLAVRKIQIFPNQIFSQGNNFFLLSMKLDCRIISITPSDFLTTSTISTLSIPTSR